MLILYYQYYQIIKLSDLLSDNKIKILLSVFICETGLQFSFWGPIYQMLISELHLPHKKNLEIAILFPCSVTV